MTISKMLSASEQLQDNAGAICPGPGLQEAAAQIHAIRQGDGEFNEYGKLNNNRRG